MGSDEALTASHALGVLCDAFPSRSWIGSRALRPGVGGATRSSWTISALTTWPACANRSRPPEPNVEDRGQGTVAGSALDHEGVAASSEVIQVRSAPVTGLALAESAAAGSPGRLS